MKPSDIDIDRLSDRELADLATELWKQLAARGHPLPALMISGADAQPIGYLVPACGMGISPVKDAAFLSETKRRIDNPPDRYLSEKEFLASLENGPTLSTDCGSSAVRHARPKR